MGNPSKKIDLGACIPTTLQCDLIISNRDLSSLLAAIVLRGLVEKRKNSDIFWIGGGLYDKADLAELLQRGQRSIVFVGFAPSHDNAALLDAVGFGEHYIIGICDVTNPALWNEKFPGLHDLTIEPHACTEYVSCPGRVILSRFGNVLTPYQKMFCEFSHDASPRGEKGVHGTSKTIHRAVGEDLKYDYRRTKIVNWYAFNHQPNQQITDWAEGRKG